MNKKERINKLEFKLQANGTMLFLKQFSKQSDAVEETSEFTNKLVSLLILSVHQIEEKGRSPNSPLVY